MREHSLNPLAKIRDRQIPWVRRTLGLFVVVWLNMALQPCAMAFADMQGRDCLHCPPSHSMDMSSPVAHDEVPRDVPCMTQMSQCGVLDDYNLDGRTVQIKVKNTQSDIPAGIAPALVTVPVLVSVPVSCRKVAASFRTVAAPPLNLLYCVYLI